MEEIKTVKVQHPVLPGEFMLVNQDEAGGYKKFVKAPSTPQLVPQSVVEKKELELEPEPEREESELQPELESSQSGKRKTRSKKVATDESLTND